MGVDGGWAAGAVDSTCSGFLLGACTGDAGASLTISLGASLDVSRGVRSTMGDTRIWDAEVVWLDADFLLRALARMSLAVSCGDRKPTKPVCAGAETVAVGGCAAGVVATGGCAAEAVVAGG